MVSRSEWRQTATARVPEGQNLQPPGRVGRVNDSLVEMVADAAKVQAAYVGQRHVQRAGANLGLQSEQ